MMAEGPPKLFTAKGLPKLFTAKDPPNTSISDYGSSVILL